MQCIAVCCSVLQCVAVCCRVLQGVTVCCCSVLLQCAAVYCSLLQFIAVCCSMLQSTAVRYFFRRARVSQPRTHARSHAQTHTHARSNTNPPTHTHTHTRTHTHTHTHTCTADTSTRIQQAGKCHRSSCHQRTWPVSTQRHTLAQQQRARRQPSAPWPRCRQNRCQTLLRRCSRCSRRSGSRRAPHKVFLPQLSQGHRLSR